MVKLINLLVVCLGGVLGVPQGRAPGLANRGTGREYMERTENGGGSEKGYPQPRGPSPQPTTPTPPPCPAGQGYLIAALSTAHPGGDEPPKGYQPPACPPPATTTTQRTSTKTTTTNTTPTPTTKTLPPTNWGSRAD